MHKIIFFPEIVFKVSMIRKYHNHNLKTNPWHGEEEPHNNHETPGGQKKSNQLSLPYQENGKTKMDTKQHFRKPEKFLGFNSIFR